MPLTNNAIPQSIATNQKDIIGRPKIIINPTAKRMNAAKALHPIKFKIFLTCATNAVEEIDSKRKNTPVRAINHNKLTFGTNKSKIPIVRINAPKNIDHKIFDKNCLFSMEVIVL